MWRKTFSLILLGIFGLLSTYVQAQSVSYDHVDWLESGIIVQRGDDVLVYDNELQLLGGLYNLGLIWQMVPSPDGHYIALLINDKTPSAASTQIWDLVQKTLIFTLSSVSTDAFAQSLDSRFLAIDYQTGQFSASNRLSIYSVAENEVVQSFIRPNEQGAAVKIIWTQDYYLGELNENFNVWQVDPTLPYSVKYVGAYPIDETIRGVTSASDEHKFAFALQNIPLEANSIRVIDAETLAVATTLPLPQEVVQFYWQSTVFVVSFRDRTRAFINAETGQMVSSFNPGRITSFAPSPDGTKIMATDEVGMATIYSSTGEVLYTRDIAADVEALSLTPSPTQR